MKPATPLPWHDEMAPQGNRAVSDVSDDVAADSIRHETDALYIVHAANAYPQLVAELRENANHGPECDSTCAPSMRDSARDLLVELGETS